MTYFIDSLYCKVKIHMSDGGPFNLGGLEFFPGGWNFFWGGGGGGGVELASGRGGV